MPELAMKALRIAGEGLFAIMLGLIVVLGLGCLLLLGAVFFFGEWKATADLEAERRTECIARGGKIVETRFGTYDGCHDLSK